MAAPLLRVALAALCAVHASAAVIGIDFGARFIKVGIIQPGKGIELVLNEASKRKSSSAAGFNSAGERVYADDSFNLLGKLPGKQFVYSKLLLGKNVSHPHVLSFGELGYPYQFSEDPVTGAVIIEFDQDIRYRAEEAVAFVLSYCKQIAEKEAGSPVKDTVITIPAFFKETERAAMHNAAAIAGLNVLSLMHENTAFAFKYGFDKESEFSAEEETNVLFYNMGAASYQVSLVSFSTSVGKKNKTTGSMVVRGVASDEMLGGRLFDQAVLDMLADEFERQYPQVSPIRESVRAMGKLRKESERIKDVLSANKEFKVGIEAVHEDRDLKLVMKRSDFEDRCEALFPRLLPPLDRVLAQANMSKKDVHRVELIGGATRIHRVKEAVKDYFGFPTSASINADEAGALGATLYAAKLSTSFRLRDFHIVDYYPHAIRVKLGTDAESPERDDTEGGEENAEEGGDEAGKRRGKDKLLFKAGSKFPHKKLITMSRTDDLEILLSYADGGSPISSFNVSGVSAALARLTSDKRVPIGKPKVSVTFALSASGLLHVAKSEIALEMQETYDDYEEVPMTEEEIAAAVAAEAAQGAAGEALDDKKGEEEDAQSMGEAEAEAERATKAAEEGEGEEGEKAGEEEAEATDEEAEAVPDALTATANATANATATANANASAAVRTKKVQVEKERKRVHYSALKAEETVLSAVRPLTEEQVAEAVVRNLELLKAENVRKSNAAAKNDVESYIIHTRDTLSTDESYMRISSDEERGSISAQLEQAEEWLYEEGRDLDAKAYAAKLKELKALVAPVALRASEMVARPKVVSQAVEAINWTTSILETWAADRPEVTAAERDNVAAMCANFTSWLAGLEEAQAALAPTDTPAFLSTEVSAELAPIEREVRRLIKKPKPKPAKPAKKNATKADAANATGTEAGADETPDEAAEAAGGEEADTNGADSEGEGGAEGGEPVKEEL